METDPAYKQIIPYLVFTYENKYFLMQRQKKASETRLQSKYSLGIGGHIREEDMENCTLVDWAKREFEEEIDLGNPHWHEARRHDFVESEMREAVETLESAGVATWTSELDTSIHGITRRIGGAVALTPAGRWVLFEYLRDAHGIPMEAAAPAQLYALDFEALVRECETGAPNEFARFSREIEAWVDHRGDDALVELVDAARTTADPAIRNMALAVLGEGFGASAEAPVRALLDDRACRGAALVWLVEHDLEPAEALCDPDPAVLVEVLALTLVNRGPKDMAEVFDHTGNHDQQITLLQSLWRQPSPAVEVVLYSLGRSHQTPRVAKAARKAAMQHASFQANERP